MATIWIWKAIEISNLKDKAQTEQLALKAEANQQLLQAHSQHLQLLAKPFVWALRTEMMQGNLNQVNLYMADMVKEQNIQRIIVADTKGTIIASTNKKDEGRPWAEVITDADVNIANTQVDTAANVLTMTSPIMGFNNRLGTLLIKYTVPNNNQ
ncbi:hypothetical protein GCM10027049_09220 [Mucilaginibacter puniceus]